MESEKYIKFLEKQARENPVKIEVSARSDSFRISWESDEGKPTAKGSSDILETLYLGKDMQETVIINRKVAILLQDRLRGLEEENIRMRRRLRLLKFAVAFLIITALMSIFIVISQYPSIRIF